MHVFYEALCKEGGNSPVRAAQPILVCVILLRLGERKRHSVDYIELLLGGLSEGIIDQYMHGRI
jgi:hypothetical protein